MCEQAERLTPRRRCACTARRDVDNRGAAGFSIDWKARGMCVLGNVTTRRQAELPTRLASSTPTPQARLPADISTALMKEANVCYTRAVVNPTTTHDTRLPRTQYLSVHCNSMSASRGVPPSRLSCVSSVCIYSQCSCNRETRRQALSTSRSGARTVVEVCRGNAPCTNPQIVLIHPN